MNPPILPYLGLYLTDLTFIEDGNADFVKSDDITLINFAKYRKISVVIREIQQYQQTQFNFEVVPIIYDYFQSLNPMTEDLLYSASLKLEPQGTH